MRHSQTINNIVLLPENMVIREDSNYNARCSRVMGSMLDYAVILIPLLDLPLYRMNQAVAVLTAELARYSIQLRMH